MSNNKTERVKKKTLSQEKNVRYGFFQFALLLLPFLVGIYVQYCRKGFNRKYRNYLTSMNYNETKYFYLGLVTETNNYFKNSNNYIKYSISILMLMYIFLYATMLFSIAFIFFNFLSNPLLTCITLCSIWIIGQGFRFIKLGYIKHNFRQAMLSKGTDKMMKIPTLIHLWRYGPDKYL